MVFHRQRWEEDNLVASYRHPSPEIKVIVAARNTTTNEYRENNPKKKGGGGGGGSPQQRLQCSCCPQGHPLTWETVASRCGREERLACDQCGRQIGSPPKPKHQQNHPADSARLIAVCLRCNFDLCAQCYAEQDPNHHPSSNTTHHMHHHTHKSSRHPLPTLKRHVTFNLFPNHSNSLSASAARDNTHAPQSLPQTPAFFKTGGSNRSRTTLTTPTPTPTPSTPSKPLLSFLVPSCSVPSTSCTTPLLIEEKSESPIQSRRIAPSSLSFRVGAAQRRLATAVNFRNPPSSAAAVMTLDFTHPERYNQVRPKWVLEESKKKKKSHNNNNNKKKNRKNQSSNNAPPPPLVYTRVSLERFPDPEDYGWILTGSALQAPVAFYERVVKKQCVVQLNVDYTTGAIRTLLLDHRRQKVFASSSSTTHPPSLSHDDNNNDDNDDTAKRTPALRLCKKNNELLSAAYYQEVLRNPLVTFPHLNSGSDSDSDGRPPTFTTPTTTNNDTGAQSRTASAHYPPSSSPSTAYLPPPPDTKSRKSNSSSSSSSSFRRYNHNPTDEMMIRSE